MKIDIKSRRFFILLVFVLFLSSSANACCCKSSSCTFVKKTVTKSVNKAIKKLKDNDFNFYATNLHKLNDYMRAINNVQDAIEKKEKLIAQEEKAEDYYIKKKNELLKKIVELQKLYALANSILAKNEVTQSNLLLLERIK